MLSGEFGNHIRYIVVVYSAYPFSLLMYDTLWALAAYLDDHRTVPSTWTWAEMHDIF